MRGTRALTKSRISSVPTGLLLSIQDAVAQGRVATGGGDEAFEVVIGLHIAGKLHPLRVAA